MRKKTILTAALFALLVLPLAVQAQQQGQGGRNPEQILGNPRALARYLGLSQEQAATFRQLRQELQASLQPLREAQKGLREAYRDALEATPQNACAIGDAAIDVHDNQEQIRAALESFDDKFSAILTPEQLAKYEALKEAARILRGGEES